MSKLKVACLSIIGVAAVTGIIVSHGGMSQMAKNAQLRRKLKDLETKEDC